MLALQVYFGILLQDVLSLTPLFLSMFTVLLQAVQPMTSCARFKVVLWDFVARRTSALLCFLVLFQSFVARRSANNIFPCLFERISCTSHRPMTSCLHFTSLSALVLCLILYKGIQCEVCSPFSLSKGIEFPSSSMNLEIALQAWSFF